MVMTTWHQDQAIKRDKLFFNHKTKWAVVINPPNRMAASMLYDTLELAEVYVRALPYKHKQYASILAPSP